MLGMSKLHCQIHFQLNLIDEKCLEGICHGQLCQQRMKRAFDKKIRPRNFYPGDLLLRKVIMQSHSDPRGKWTPNYEEPYIMKRAFSEGALIWGRRSTSSQFRLSQKILRIKRPAKSKTQKGDLGKNGHPGGHESPGKN